MKSPKDFGHEGYEHQFEENSSKFSDTISKGLNGLRTLIKENPKAVLGTALGIGLLVGLIVASKGKNEKTNQKQ